MKNKSDDKTCTLYAKICDFGCDHDDDLSVTILTSDPLDVTSLTGTCGGWK